MAGNYGGLYNIDDWGEPYFTVNTDGHLCVKVHGNQTTPEQEINVPDVIEAAKKRGVQFPMILRFPDVLKHRLDSLHTAFEKAIEETGYNGHYQGVFPVKVNQNKDIIHDFVRFGQCYSYGLEAGSKPELLIAMSCLANANVEKEKRAPFLVCNGYKDADYVKLALSARAMGLNVIIVLEMEEELNIIINQYNALKDKVKVEPVIGVRAKLLTKIPGHFGSTAGMHGKFGLPEEKIYDVAQRLKYHGKLHWLKLLHFHVGSMIPTTKIVSNAASEAAGIYCTLVKRYGAEMTTLDCGGGLGVDYDGTLAGDSDMSVAYGLEEYASSIVKAVRLECNEKGVRHPVLCTESGRAMVSHHSMIILEALSAIPEPMDDEIPDPHVAAQKDPESLFQSAETGLPEAGQGQPALQEDGRPTIYNYHMNLCVFSLVPDFWGIKQLFPMMPVSRLNEEPTRKGRFIDITCDSDGKIEKFISNEETLPLHPLDPERGGYYVAVLLSGAYQEALSSKHNLFGGPSLVRVESGGIVRADQGPTTEELIRTMRYDVNEDIIRVIKERAQEHGVGEMVGKFVKTVLDSMPYLVEYQATLTNVDPIGGLAGVAWDIDRNNPPKELLSIKIWGNHGPGGRINAISFTYLDEQGDLVAVGPWGKQTGEIRTIANANNLVALRGSTNGSYVTGLTFKTSLTPYGTSFFFGDTISDDTFSIDVHPNSFIAFYGRADEGGLRAISAYPPPRA